MSSKHQITIPVAILRAAGIKVGERVSVTCDGMGRVVLERERDVLAKFVGALTGVYHRDEVDTLRDEWA
ncbi:AbrB/MazE/SpoVT family DNA-binding domain-containing protein [Gemmatimonas sp.]|uniref:AbrB/MazE/SpoVT family DNA-binding domain-containing protein n=1 Tax=Gemmatimonas sp. TaxID=1962908 RepID=UPI00356229CA